MNKPIGRLFLVALVMFGALLVSTSWWTVLRADDLDHDTSNHRAGIRAQKVHRGTIYAADGSAIARSTRAEEAFYPRPYPQGRRFGPPIGYSSAAPPLGESEVER